MKKLSYIILVLATVTTFVACEKQDPFVDRVVAPVLVQVIGDDGSPSSGLTTDPTVSSSFGETANMSLKVLELDKTNILDYTKGIDSIPVASISLLVSFRGGSEIGTFTTGADGLATVSVPWSSLGITESGSTVSLSATGTYNDQAFTKLFKLASN
ncbi:hypothetical protein [Arcticibacterium luteifluviistationis]|uniref:Uncharacterized protein n=1 Tax=Arcticibacterium luteifluviistationis TaxID=1784714 RepID=A0A2Z4GDK8_9BACT|nr:hypothetical protein [Arcticibacterium luteifluviistationis]AWV99244.1 hypothetical protein DJ013_14150 [Arcticibacterium luteifluviistationis]